MNNNRQSASKLLNSDRELENGEGSTTISKESTLNENLVETPNSICINFNCKSIPVIEAVYCIEDLNGKKYIGSTVNFKKRVLTHYRLLKQNKHHSKKLQNAYNKHTESFFKIYILEQNPVNPHEREQFYIDLYNSYNNGYNASKNVNNYLIKFTLDSKQKNRDITIRFNRKSFKSFFISYRSGKRSKFNNF